MIKRNFRGVGNHTISDMMYLSAYLGEGNLADAQPDERLNSTFGGLIAGGILGLPDLILDEDMKVNKGCARYGLPCGNLDEECQFRKGDKCNPPRWKFDWTVMIEPIRDDVECLQ